jgi:hypothetical protein
MSTKYILAVLAFIFLTAGASRLLAPGRSAQSRTWLLIGGIFAAVSLWLFTRP